MFEKLPNIGNGKWIAIGRLDFNTEGLLLFTNSGELANKMMHPRYEVEREYAVRVMGTLTPEQQQSLLTGHRARGRTGAKCEKIEDGGGEGANHWYHLVLKEGRNREVRRLIEALGLTVSRLIRTRYGTIAMPSRLKRGQTLELVPEEVTAVLAAAGMRATGPMPQQPGRRDGERRPQGKGPRPSGQRPREGARREAEGNVAPPALAGSDEDAPHDPDVIEPGNSAAGAPTHANRSVKSYFKNAGAPHGRPQGKGGPRYGQGASRGQGNGARGHGGKPGRGAGNGQGRGAPQHGARGQGSPYVTTTLTIPGGMPEGLPGTGGQRPKGQGSWGNGGQPRPKGPPGAAAPAGKRGRGRRNRRGGKGPGAPDSDNRGNEARANQAPHPGDDNRGNVARATGSSHSGEDNRGNEARADRGPNPADDNRGNIARVNNAPRAADDDRGNVAPRPKTPPAIDDDAGNR